MWHFQDLMLFFGSTIQFVRDYKEIMRRVSVGYLLHWHLNKKNSMLDALRPFESYSNEINRLLFWNSTKKFAIYTPRQRILVRTKGNLSSNTTFFDPFSAVERYHEETYHDFSSENETQGCELNALQCPETKKYSLNQLKEWEKVASAKNQFTSAILNVGTTHNLLMFNRWLLVLLRKIEGSW